MIGITPGRRWRRGAWIGQMIALALVACLAAGTGRAEAVRPLVVGAESGFAPYSDVRADGRPEGMAVDLMVAVARAADLPIEFRTGSWNDLWADLQAGRIDVMVDAAIVPERMKLVEFTQSHTVGYDAFFVRRGSPPVTSLDAARQLRIVMARGSAAYHALRVHGLDERLVLADDQAESLRRLAAGLHDATVLPVVQGKVLVDRLGLNELVEAGPPLSEYRREFAIAVAKGRTELRDRLDQGLAIAKASGEYDRIYTHWLGAPDTAIMPMRQFAWAAASIGGLLALLALWTWSLRRQVRLRTANLQREVAERQAAERELAHHRDQLQELVVARTAALAESQRRFRLLAQVVERIAAVRDLPGLMAIVRTAARELTGADGATLVLREDEHCHYADEDAIGPLWKGQRFPLEACISGWAMLHGEAVAIEDIYSDTRIPHAAYRSTFVKSLAMVPIGRGHPVGAIGCYWASRHLASAEELHLQQALADAAAAGLANLQLFQRLEAAHREAQASADLLRVTMDTTPALMSYVDRDCRYRRVNRGYSEWFGLSEAQIVGRLAPEVLGDAAWQRIGPKVRQALAGEVVDFEIEVPYALGGSRWTHITYSPHRNAAGKVQGFVAHVIDISSRKRTEQALASALRRLSAHMENSPLAVVEFDADFSIIRWSAEAERLFGWSAGEVLGKPLGELRWVHEEDRARVDAVVADLSGGRVTRSQCINRNYRKDGSVVHCEWYKSAIYDDTGRLSSVLALGLDVTDRQRAEAARRKTELARSVALAQEEERRRLASALHDSFGANLLALNLGLGSIRQALVAAELGAPLKRLEDAQALLTNITSAIRETCLELRPASLDRFGLVPALETYARQFQERTGMAIRVDAGDCLQRLPSDLENTAFRIAQEALTNCVKHGRAKRVELRLEAARPNLRLTVSDDGKGFDPEAEGAAGLGLITMRERAELAGGHLEIRSEAGGGTQVIAHL